MAAGRTSVPASSMKTARTAKKNWSAGEGASRKENQLTNKSHTETKDTTKIGDSDEFKQIVNSRVDPSSSLTKKNSERIWNDGLAHCLRAEHHFPPRESSQHQRRQEPIFSEEEQVLLVKGVDDVFRIVFDDIGIGEDGNPVTFSSLRGFDSVHGETTWETGDSSENGFESLGEMMGYVVLENYAGEQGVSEAPRKPSRAKKAHPES